VPVHVLHHTGGQIRQGNLKESHRRNAVSYGATHDGAQMGIQAGAFTVITQMNEMNLRLGFICEPPRFELGMQKPRPGTITRTLSFFDKSSQPASGQS
jgi:hypothetical protein